MISLLTSVSIGLVYKIGIAVVAGLIPVGTYKISRSFLTPDWALFSSFLVPTTMVFFTSIPGKQHLGEFYMLAIVLLVCSNIEGNTPRGLFLLLSFGLVLSHYASAILFVFVLVVATCYIAVHRLALGSSGRLPFALSSIAFVGIVSVAWYMYFAESTVFFNFVMVPYASFEQLFQISSGNADVQSRTGLYFLTLDISSPIAQMYRLLHLSVFLGIGLGALLELPDALRGEHNQRQETIYAVAGGFIGLLVIGTVVKAGLGIDRIYEWGIVFLAPFVTLFWARLCGAIGTLLNSDRVPKHLASPADDRRASQVFGIFVIVFLLFNSGLVHFAAGSDGRGFPLRYEATDYPMYQPEDTAAPEWVMKYLSANQPIGADEQGQLLLYRTLGLDEDIRMAEDSVVPSSSVVGTDGCFFLRQTNVQGQAVVKPSGEPRTHLNVSRATVHRTLGQSTKIYDSSVAVVGCHSLYS
jgi:uncharacterized membrane protein